MTKKISIPSLAKSAFIILIIMLIPQMLAAKGSQDNQRDFNEDLQAEIEILIYAVENGEMTAAEARAEIEEISNQYKIEHNNEFNKMLGMFDGLEKGERTTERVREQLLVVNEETQIRLRTETQSRLQEKDGDDDCDCEPSGTQEKTQTKNQDNKK